MNNSDKPDGRQQHKQQQADSEPRKRKPYEPPAIEETSAFETLALECAFADDSCAVIGGAQDS